MANARPYDTLPSTILPEITSRAGYELVIDGYDAAIWYMDRHVGELLGTLRELGIEEEVGFVISADHGESWGEHNIYSEHAGATEPVHHVPLIISLPGVTPVGSDSDALVYNVDWVATLAELLGADVPPEWDGVSIAPALRGEPWPGHEYVVLDHALFIAQRAVFDGRWFFIRTYHPGLFHFDELSLYDQLRDPHQTRNVAAEQPQVVALMEHRLNEWTQAQMAKPGAIPDPLMEVALAGPWRVFALNEWVDRMRRDGYAERAEQIRRRYEQTPRRY